MYITSQTIPIEITNRITVTIDLTLANMMYNIQSAMDPGWKPTPSHLARYSALHSEPRDTPT